MKQENFREKLSSFMEGKGFYIVLFLCVAVIGVSGYYLFSAVSKNHALAAQVSGTAQVQTAEPKKTEQAAEPPIVSQTPPAQKPAPAKRAEPVQEAETASAPTRVTVEEPVQETGGSLLWTWPVRGELVNDYSLEVLAYDETMGDWRTHSGVDIAAALGSSVSAAASGTVAEVYDDDLMGTTVVVDHGGGLQSVYSNLAGQPPVEPGDSVETGETIGSVGKTAIAESLQASHLHFEMRQDGVSTDPEAFLPK